MKKLYGWLLAVMLPVAVYCALFLVNDPYGYFGAGLEDENAASGPMGRMLAYRNNAYDAIMIGDSKTLSLDLTALSEKTGRKFINLSYMGCMATEVKSLLQWCLDTQPVPLREVIIVSGFHDVNTLMQQNRIETTEKVIQSPLHYIFCIDTADTMFRQLFGKQETVDSTTRFLNRTPEERKEVYEANAERMKYFASGFSYDLDAIQGMEDICDTCIERGIAVTFVLPPFEAGYYDLCERYGLLSVMDEYKERLSHHATVVDFEYKDCALNSRYDDFSDLIHFYLSTKEDFLRSLVEKDNTYCRIWKNGVCYPQGSDAPW